MVEADRMLEPCSGPAGTPLECAERLPRIGALHQPGRHDEAVAATAGVGVAKVGGNLSGGSPTPVFRREAAPIAGCSSASPPRASRPAMTASGEGPHP